MSKFTDKIKRYLRAREVRRKRKKLLKTPGWLVDMVCPGNDIDFWDIHTEGLVKKYGHPEIQMVIMINHDVTGQIFHSIVAMIANGQRFDAGTVSDDVAENGYSTAFIRVHDNMVRMIIPDKNNDYNPETMEKELAAQYTAHPEQFVKAELH